MTTDDAILVNMALDGQREAFDQLVRKHRSRVLSTARMLTGTADGAEDVAQQAFVTAFANLRFLRDPASFGPWLTAIARRCASRQWVANARETTGPFELVMASHHYDPNDEIVSKARIAEMLGELTALSRRVMVMHYLDGYSCREIGESLGIPSGTVKRILHESRTSLRASSERKGGVREMAQKNQGPRHMDWWIHGEWPGSMMHGALRQSIGLTINKNGLTPEQIAKRIDANEVYVREALDVLEAEELVEKTGRGRYRNAFVALDAEDWIVISREIRAKSEQVADLLIEGIPELQAAWESSPKPAQGFDWNAGIWPVFAIMVCNTGLARNGSSQTAPEPPVHPASGRRYWAGGREDVAPEHVLWAPGFSIDARSTGFSYGYFWSFGLPFEWRGIDWPEDRRSLLAAVASGSCDLDSAAKAAGLDTTQAREAAAKLIDLDLLELKQDGLALTFPVFAAEDDTAMLPAVDKTCRRLAKQVDSVAGIVDEVFPELGFGHLEKQFGAWRAWLRGNAAAEGLRVLYNRGILSHPGDPASADFCLVGWFDETRLFAYESGD